MKRAQCFVTKGTTNATMSDQLRRKTLLLASAVVAVKVVVVVDVDVDVDVARCALCSLNMAINASSHASCRSSLKFSVFFFFAR